MDPISSSWRKNSPNSKGGVTAARVTCQKNIPRLPNHSRNCVIGFLALGWSGSAGSAEFVVSGRVRPSPCRGEVMPAARLSFPSTGILMLDHPCAVYVQNSKYLRYLGCDAFLTHV